MLLVRHRQDSEHAMPFSPDRINRLVVRDTLQTTRDDNIFAIGDCACYVLPGEGKRRRVLRWRP
jgi:NADH dehydrogenase FAD-containing subunit